MFDLLEPKKSKIIKYSKKCRDLNREYELNNNADLDNGVYNAFVNEQEQEAERREQERLDEEKKGGDGNIVFNLNGLDAQFKDSDDDEKPNVSRAQKGSANSDADSLELGDVVP